MSRQGDQGTTKVGKRISRVVLTVWATGFIQCGRGMLMQRLPEHATPTLDGGRMIMFPSKLSMNVKYGVFSTLMT